MNASASGTGARDGVRAHEGVDAEDDGPAWWPAFAAVLRRELRIAGRRRTEVALPLVFFVAAAGLFPLAVGPEPQTLKLIGPGVVWVCALLATLLAVPSMFAADHAEGTLEQWLLLPQPLALVVAAKMAALWLVTGVPLVILSPLLGVAFALPGLALAVLPLSLALGTLVLAAFGTLAAALTLGLRAGAMLLVVLVVPLAVPALIFGAAAVSAIDAGLSPAPHLSLLGALALATVFGAPFGAASALRVALE